MFRNKKVVLVGNMHWITRVLSVDRSMGRSTYLEVKNLLAICAKSL